MSGTGRAKKITAHTDKILSLERLVEALEGERPAGRKIVFTNGCFDIIHPGHVAYLEDAASRGDVLVLGLNSDASVRRLKGPGRPINPQGDRALLLAGLASIDYVTFFDQDTPLELIMAVKPDVLVKGGDWTVENIVGHEFVLERGGEVYSLPFKEGYSTTRLIDKIKKLSDPPEKGRAS
ncbi:MAG TPA: D-glycero-beta-D-manno-heptose 1-phosphate adenylyltransferase [Candidatus Glassbacteria bacterium]|nr:D-glycero-beta-D-manno-heptose 1-phosphate adenylyltransferase [Candidatus Glassbacteria bacterium]